MIANPQVVSLEYSSDPLADSVATFIDDWVGSAMFLDALGEYGITGGTHAADARLAGTPPTSVTFSQAEAIVENAIRAGQVPAPTSNTLYYVTLPPGSSLSSGDYAWHQYDSAMGFNFAVGAGSALTGFGTRLDVLTADASHEIAEASTDPGPGYTGWYVPWDVLGGEIADFCGWWTAGLDGFKVQRVWSNRAAAAGQVACVPDDPSEPFFEVGPDTPGALTIARGSSATLTVRAASPDPGVTSLKVYAYGSGVLTVSPSSTVTVAVGQTTRFTVSVPANATPGPNHAVEIESWQSGASELFSVWDVQVVVQ